MQATPKQRKSYRQSIGSKLKVQFPDGRLIPAWKLWEMAAHSPDPASDYLATETARIEALDTAHCPDVLADDRRRRAFRMALKLAAFEVIGVDGDEHDLRILAIANGLSPTDFDVAMKDGEPMLVLDADALRLLSASPGQNTSIH